MKKLIGILLIILFTISAQSYGQEIRAKFEPYTLKARSGEEIPAELGTFSVPENRSTNDSKTIELKFVRFKSTNPNPGHPIVYLSGGPGGSGIGTAKGARFPLFMALRGIADVIALDQRGTGLSNQIPACPTNATFDLDKPGLMEDYLESMGQAAQTCSEFWEKNDVDLSAYNTVENAHDIESLRIALGATKISLWGISYGSHLAFSYVKNYEKSVHKLVLAGLEGPDHTVKMPSNNEAFLRRMQQAIQLDPAALELYPDLIGLMRKVLNKVDQNPIKTNITDPRSGQKFEVGISKLDIQLVTSFFLTKNPENSKRLPLVYYQMNNNNFTEMAQMVAGLKMYAGQIQGMPLAMDAMSGISEKRWQLVLQESKTTTLGRTTNFPYPDISEHLGLPDLGADFRANPSSKVHALFFSGTLDGRTYLESANELISGFSNHAHIVINGAGHDLYMSTPKVTTLILDFLNDKKVISHKIDIAIPEFILPQQP